jgi:hypothetical protein
VTGRRWKELKQRRHERRASKTHVMSGRSAVPECRGSTRLAVCLTVHRQGTTEAVMVVRPEATRAAAVRSELGNSARRLATGGVHRLEMVEISPLSPGCDASWLGIRR